MEIKLGKMYRDKITGFTGMATGCATYITGCSRAGLEPAYSGKGTPTEAQWFDVQRLVEVESASVNLKNGKTPGGGANPPKFR
jgi:hypothetical protein